MHSATSNAKPFPTSSRKHAQGSLCVLTRLLAFILLINAAAAGQGLHGSLAEMPDTSGRARAAFDFGQSTDSSSAPATDPATILRRARLIYVRKKTIYIEATELENELRKRPEFQRWGLAITRNEADADLILEVSRKVFTRFVFTVLDPRTNIVVMSGKLSSLGGTLSTKIAKRFIAEMQRVRE